VAFLEVAVFFHPPESPEQGGAGVEPAYETETGNKQQHTIGY
jgi:hypothetical protein